MSLDPISRELIALALAEDLGDIGDVTAAATIAADVRGTARFVSRERGVVAGLDAAAAVCEAVDPALRLARKSGDGDRISPGDVLAEVTGRMRSLLSAERTALNLLCHLSGVATLTARYVAEVDGTGCVVRDTRKTLPGMRMLAKAAVAAGGGSNHRRGLYDGLLVKDNHVAAAGGVGAACRAALDAAGDLPVQIEVDDLTQLEQALAAGARSILLDNFSIQDLSTAVGRCAPAGDIFLEASGGVTLQTIRAIAETGVDAVAVGALTHSAPALDIGLDYAGSA